MTNNRKGQRPTALPMPTNIAAQMTITAFTDGRQPAIQCSTDPLNSLSLLVIALQAAINALRPPVKGQADPVDKKREYLGPREVISYGKDKG